MLVFWEEDIEYLVDHFWLAILLRVIATDYVDNSFSLERAGIPHKDLEDLANIPSGVVYIVPGVPGDIDNVGRPPTGGIRECSVQCGFQKANVDPSDWNALKTNLVLVQQLVATFMLNPPGPPPWQFQRIEFLKDENNVPFSFMGLRNANVFEAYFTAVYSRGVSPPT